MMPASELAARSRLICDNDYAGDPDGLVQLAHHLLMSSVVLKGVIASLTAPYDPVTSETSTSEGVVAARKVAELAGRNDVPILEGAKSALVDRSVGQPSRAADLIVGEAALDEESLPLYLACGGGLTNVATAWLQDRRISERLTVVWIGGPEHPDLAPPLETVLPMEYNLSIDPLAAQVVFNDSDLDVWQVPRDAYRQVLASRSELQTRMQPGGGLGQHLLSSLESMRERLATTFGLDLGETFILGDSPLVLLTGLLSSFDPTPSSCRWVERRRPSINEDGSYGPPTTDCTMRIFTNLDSRLLLEDLYAKLRLLSS